jgi:starch-binding outer membrane protein, SusD/RagB family
MNNIYRKGNLLMAFVAMLTMSSCNDFLEITPLNSIVVENYWEKKSEVEAVITSCYVDMESSNFNKRLIVWGELRGDNVAETSTLKQNTELHDLYTNNITTSNSWNDWAPFYNVINLCNNVLYYAPQAKEKDGNFSEEELHSYEAEARCIRALCYFQLIRTFQKVPLVLTASIGDDEDFKVAAATEDSVINQIVNDLTWSEQYIWSAGYFNNIAERKGRFNKQSVKALLADVYLWNGDYQQCADLCQEIINEKVAEYQSQLSDMQSGNYNSYMQNGDLSLYEGYPLIQGQTGSHDAYDRIFVDGNSFESILEMQYDAENNISNAGLTMFYGNLTNVGSGQLNTAAYLTTTDNNLFSDKNDVRLYEYTGYDRESTAQSYYILKYRTSYANGNTGSLRTTYPNWIVYRLTDVMLMRAEALAYLGGEANCQEAFTLIKAVNERSCGGQTKLTYDQTSIKEQILGERQRELMFEGKRWYDLVRMVRHSENPTQAMRTLRNTYLLRKYDTGGQDAIARMASVNNLYLPFYQSEVDVNPLLEVDQNPAYKN